VDIDPTTQIGADGLRYTAGTQPTDAAPYRRDTSTLRGAERSDPAAPEANNGILYYRDNGSGKTQLCARFASGAVQVVATQP
jgi:hypothetical protein